MLRLLAEGQGGAVRRVSAIVATGSTRVCAIIGTPIAQVKSPENFNRAFAETRRDSVMIGMDVPVSGVASFVALARSWQNLDGFVVTIPHKQTIAGSVDKVSSRVSMLGAANVVRRENDGTLVADMLDGLGFVAALDKNGFQPAGKNALLIGSGGAGGAIAHALCEAGVACLAISEIDAARAALLAEMLRSEFPSVSITTTRGELGEFDVVANATPLGMKEGDPLPIAAELISKLKDSAFVTDVVTSPEVTPFLAAAQARGLKIQTGPEMARAQLELLGAHMGVF